MSNGQTFQPREHLINIKNGKGVSEYLEVKWRLVWFRQECPQGTIETEIVHLDLDKDVEVEAYAWNAEKRRSEKAIKTAKGVAIFRATVHDGKGGSATGTKSENAANFPDFIEKAESGSIGRALAALGYGTQFAPEFNEEHRIVDAPVETPDNGNGAQSNGNSASAVNTSTQGQRDQQGQAPRAGNPQRPNNGINPPSSGQQGQVNANAMPAQISSIEKMCKQLGEPLPHNLSKMTYNEAKDTIIALNAKRSEKQPVKV